MSNVPTVLKTELQQLDQALRSDPRYRRMLLIRALLEDYEPVNTLPPTLLDRVPPSPAASRAHAQDGKSKEAAIKETVAEWLDGGKALHRTVILRRLIEAGLMGHEKRPLRQLAAYLSSWRDTFASDGRGNFSLRKETAA